MKKKPAVAHDNVRISCIQLFDRILSLESRAREVLNNYIIVRIVYVVHSLELATLKISKVT